MQNIPGLIHLHSNLEQEPDTEWFSWCVCYLYLVHTYGALLESDLTYTPLGPDQMDSSALDMSLDEDTSSMDEIPQKCPLKPQKKNKGKCYFTRLLEHRKELFYQSFCVVVIG